MTDCPLNDVVIYLTSRQEKICFAFSPRYTLRFGVNLRAKWELFTRAKQAKWLVQHWNSLMRETYLHGDRDWLFHFRDGLRIHRGKPDGCYYHYKAF